MSRAILEYRRNKLRESKADQERFKQWIKDGYYSEVSSTDKSEDEAEKFTDRVFNLFLNYKQRIKSPYNDFYYWMNKSTFDDFYTYLKELQVKVTNDEITKNREKEGAELVYSDNDWKVYHITNYEASAKYGKGTKWCITGTKRWNDGDNGKETFLDYHENNHVEFYFFIKNGTEKYALALYPDGKTYEIFNAEDVSCAYIPDAPHVKGLPDVSEKDDKRILINAIASDKISDDILLNAIEELATGGDDEDPGDYEIIFASSPEEVSRMIAERIPDCYLEFNAVCNGKLSKEEFESMFGYELSDEEIENCSWDGDLPEIYLDDKYTTKIEACDPKNYQGHKYWYLFTDINNWNPCELYWADDKVGLFNTIRQLLNFDDMYSFLDAVADYILTDVAEGRVSKKVLTDLGISDTKESINEDLESVYYHGSSDVIEGKLNHSINWITSDFNYAKSFALALSDKGYVYTCIASTSNLFDCGKTGYSVYTPYPIPPYQVSKEFKSITDRLDLSDNEVKELLKKVIDEFNVSNDGYKMRIDVVVRSTAFKDIVKSKGYDGVRAIEFDKTTKKDCETFGLYSSVEIIDVEEVLINESLDETYKSDKFELGTAGYILPDGSFVYMDEYHGEDPEYRSAGHVEFSNTHCEEDTCVRIFKQPNEVQYKKLEEVIDRYLDEEEYCKVEIGNDFYEVYSLRENACQDPYWDEQIGNWTGYKLVRIIKNYFNRTEESLDEAKAITFGDLDYAKKTDTRKMMSGRGTGHFGTGFYFVGEDGKYGLDSEGNIKYDYEPSRPIYEIDLDAYHLYQPKDNDSAYKLHDALRNINNDYHPSLDSWLFKNLNTEQIEDELYSLGWQADDLDEDIDDDFDLDDLDDLDFDDEGQVEDTAEKSSEKYRELVKEFVAKYDLEDWINCGYNSFEDWLKTNRTGTIENEIRKAIEVKDEECSYVEYAIKYLSNLFNINKDEFIKFIHDAYENNGEDTISTMLMKKLGYEGIDVTHLNHDAQGLSGLDNFGYGTVIYDLKPNTFKKIKEPREDKSGHYKAGESLTEMKGKNSISDEKILKYIDECIQKMKTISFEFLDYLYLTYDDIVFEEGDTVRTFGTMMLPSASNDNFTLVLNKHMFEEPEEAIKNTIYHELCHYVVMKMAIEKEIFYEGTPGKWYINMNKLNAKDYKGHGRVWQNVADKVGSATGQKISRTDDYETHTGVGAHADDKYKYIVKCKHCGNEFKYTRRTDFIKSVLDGNGHSENWHCNCSDGTMCHDFDVLKGN